jgi:hypothetical protein
MTEKEERTDDSAGDIPGKPLQQPPGKRRLETARSTPVRPILWTVVIVGLLLLTAVMAL